MIVWVKLGTHPSMTAKVLGKRKAPVEGDRFQIVPTRGGGDEAPIDVLCNKVSMIDGVPLYRLERF